MNWIASTFEFDKWYNMIWSKTKEFSQSGLFQEKWNAGYSKSSPLKRKVSEAVKSYGLSKR